MNHLTQLNIFLWLKEQNKTKQNKTLPTEGGTHHKAADTEISWLPDYTTVWPCLRNNTTQAQEKFTSKI